MQLIHQPMTEKRLHHCFSQPDRNGTKISLFSLNKLTVKSNCPFIASANLQGGEFAQGNKPIGVCDFFFMASNCVPQRNKRCIFCVCVCFCFAGGEKLKFCTIKTDLSISHQNFLGCSSQSLRELGASCWRIALDRHSKLVAKISLGKSPSIVG